MRKTIYFYRQRGDCVQFYDLPGSLNNVLPVRPSCFNQVFLDSSGRRTYDVTFKGIMGGVVKREHKGKELCIVRGRGIYA